MFSIFSLYFFDSREDKITWTLSFSTTQEVLNTPSTPEYTTSRRRRPTTSLSLPKTTNYPSTHSSTPSRRRRPTYRPYTTTTANYTEVYYPSSTTSDIVIYNGDDESVDDHKKHDDKHKIPKHSSPSLPNICDGNINAVATLRNELFVFKDQVSAIFFLFLRPPWKMGKGESLESFRNIAVSHLRDFYLLARPGLESPVYISLLL